MTTIAIYRKGADGKSVCVEIIQRRAGQEIKRDCERMVDISDRPDIKIGHVWGTEPEGHKAVTDA